jgi:hypothetical protein
MEEGGGAGCAPAAQTVPTKITHERKPRVWQIEPGGGNYPKGVTGDSRKANTRGTINHKQGKMFRRVFGH